MALPNFLIIGAMKSATTTLWTGLRAHPDVNFCQPKESDALIDPLVLTPAGRAKYERQCASDHPVRLTGDASTSYTKLPDFVGVPERALDLLGPQVRLIYVVREPVARAQSHHHHLLLRGRAPVAFEEALAQNPGIRDYGLYAMQLEAWLAVFPLSQIKVIRFEDYVAAPVAIFNEVLEFLGLEADSVPPPKAWNVSKEVRPPLGLAYKIHVNPAYKHIVRPLFPKRVRQWVVGLSNPNADAIPEPPLPATREALRKFYADDSARLAQILGRDTAFWPQDDHERI